MATPGGDHRTLDATHRGPFFSVTLRASLEWEQTPETDTGPLSHMTSATITGQLSSGPAVHGGGGDTSVQQAGVAIPGCSPDPKTLALGT